MAARSPFLFELPARVVVELALVPAQRLGIEAAGGANAAVASEDPLAQIAGVGAQLPLVRRRRARKM